MVEILARTRKLVQFEPGYRAVDDGDLCTQTDRHARRVRTNEATSNHHDPGRLNTGHSTDQQPSSASTTPQGATRPFNRKPIRDLAHGRQQRKATLLISYGLIGDLGPPRF